MKRTIAVLLGFLAISSAQAGELSLIGHGYSKHLDNHNFNERNYGAGFRADTGDIGIQIGAYRNSVHKDSVYVGIDWSPLSTKTNTCLEFGAGPFYGFASGYKFAVTPVIGVQASAKCDNVFVRVRAMPDPYYNAKAVGAIEVGLVIKRF